MLNFPNLGSAEGDMIPSWLAVIPHAERSKRLFGVLVCYLDDSGEEREPVITLAGYVGTADNWARFEAASRKYFDDANIEFLHTMDLYHRRGQFKGWNSAKTLKFAQGFFELVGECAPLGVEFSVDKASFNSRKAELGMKREGSPLTFCFKGLLNNMMLDAAVQKCMAMDGVDLSFVVESGKRSEPMLLAFNRIKTAGAYGGNLRSMVFEDKKKLQALQAADFLAFFCRRRRCMPKDNPRLQGDISFFEEVTRPVKTHSYFLATDFSGKA